MFGGSKNDENLPSESLNNTAELKRQLDEEKEKVKLLSSQLNTNVIILTSIISYKIDLRNVKFISYEMINMYNIT